MNQIKINFKADILEAILLLFSIEFSGTHLGSESGALLNDLTASQEAW